jgi:hypothetical protein
VTWWGEAPDLPQKVTKAIVAIDLERQGLSRRRAAAQRAIVYHRSAGCSLNGHNKMHLTQARQGYGSAGASALDTEASVRTS